MNTPTPMQSDGRDGRFYQADLSAVPQPIASLLSDYSNIPVAEQKSHILTIRNEAYAAHPYPCLGRFRFLDLDLSSYSLYQSYVLPTLSRQSSKTPTTDDERTALQDGPIFLDLGTCLGQDIRKLIHDGASPSLLYGSDVVPSFIDNGYSLFKDEHIIPRSHFLVPGDVFAASPPTPSQSASEQTNEDKLAFLDNKVDILHITAVFHLFPLPKQKLIVQRCLRLLRKTTGKPVLVLGAQAGNINPGESSRSDGSSAYRHNEVSWRQLWEGVVADDDEWRGKVKKLTVEGILGEHGGLKDRNAAVTGATDHAGEREAQNKVIGKAEAGFRWHVFWVWVEFV